MNMRLLSVICLLLLSVTACSDPASTFAGSLRGWCHTATNCTDHDRN